MKQPALGSVATAIIVAASLGFISRLDFATFAGWVSYYLLCIIPMQIVIGVFWGTNHPRFAARHGQPAKGALLALTTSTRVGSSQESSKSHTQVDFERDTVARFNLSPTHTHA